MPRLRAECAYRSALHSRVRLRGSSSSKVGLKASPIHVGDFIYCRSKYYRDSLQLPEELGLVIEIKRTNFKIPYASDKGCWLPKEAIVRSRPDLEYNPFLEKLYYLTQTAHALDCEVVPENGEHRLT